METKIKLKTRLKGSFPALILILLGIIFMIVGVYRGEVLEFFRKSITICLECVGIG